MNSIHYFDNLNISKILKDDQNYCFQKYEIQPISISDASSKNNSLFFYTKKVGFFFRKSSLLLVKNNQRKIHFDFSNQSLRNIVKKKEDNFFLNQFDKKSFKSIFKEKIIRSNFRFLLKKSVLTYKRSWIRLFKNTSQKIEKKLSKVTIIFSDIIEQIVFKLFQMSYIEFVPKLKSFVFHKFFSFLSFSIHVSDEKDFCSKKLKKPIFIDSNMDLLKYPTERIFKISSRFSLRRINPVTGLLSPHRGTDFSMPVGTSVLSVANGTVSIAKYSNIAGYFIVIQHENKLVTKYMHLLKLMVKPGQKVKKGQCIGLSGNTGRTTGPHLHYEIWVGSQAIDPLTMIFK
ncbi:peptidoglycan DD-metalloendopeptidase family protein [Candidatus Riesia pediculicola]|uniref:Peptidase M23B n=1 Tax=Riesia pediculicola (strain USDA) TaxID=515618 RepID=D4G8Y1_RIEPU|nr:peptidase M23B [Candidatus Riesia pediculicola USDA]ARC53991.1 hypothetical protein AOE55_02460 [Candidatus Riesia pediculicola]QOJ86617.1 peptidoglycan DD-metalloendopeptidase family protein [Candidatus Riesia pediculicola]